MPFALVIRHTRPEAISVITAIYAVHMQEGTGSFELTPPDATEMARRWEAVVAAGWSPYNLLACGPVHPRLDEEPCAPTPGSQLRWRRELHANRCPASNAAPVNTHRICHGHQ